MHIGLLVIEFHLEGCSSLKEKRRRLSGLRDRYGRHTNIAVCESGYQDSHQKAEWSFVAAATDAKGLSRTLDDIEKSIDATVDARIAHMSRETL